MKNKLFVSLVTVVCLMSMATTSVASTGQYSWTWNMCNGLIGHASLEIQANVGSSSVIVAYTVPPTSKESIGFVCQTATLSSVEITTLPTIPNYQGVTDVKSLSAASNVIPFTVLVNVFVGKGYVSYSFPLQYGNYITVSISPCYGVNYICHPITKTLKVTS